MQGGQLWRQREVMKARFELSKLRVYAITCRSSRQGFLGGNLVYGMTFVRYTDTNIQIKGCKVPNKCPWHFSCRGYPIAPEWMLGSFQPQKAVVQTFRQQFPLLGIFGSRLVVRVGEGALGGRIWSTTRGLTIGTYVYVLARARFHFPHATH